MVIPSNSNGELFNVIAHLLQAQINCSWKDSAFCYPAPVYATEKGSVFARDSVALTGAQDAICVAPISRWEYDNDPCRAYFRDNNGFLVIGRSPPTARSGGPK
ncbi:hypothetical protein MY3296_004125 [Beauveria thailandica]